jgi:hypothetical protein
LQQRSVLRLDFGVFGGDYCGAGYLVFGFEVEEADAGGGAAGGGAAGGADGLGVDADDLAEPLFAEVDVEVLGDVFDGYAGEPLVAFGGVVALAGTKCHQETSIAGET